MATLLEKANAIKDEKDTKIIPENIAEGVTIFGVTGTHGGGPTQPDYLCFTANIDNSTVSMEGGKGMTVLPELEYSTDGVNWNEFVIGETIITLSSAGDKAYFRGDNDTFSTESSTVQFKMTGSIAVSGNIMSLLDKTCESLTIPCEYCFSDLFNLCSALTSAPKLPATTLTKGCYMYMFTNCKNLTVAPELPATTLADSCYFYMFAECTGLMTAPKLPATTLVRQCYGHMFLNCTNLIAIPKLQATELIIFCYDCMFSGCLKIKLSETPSSTYIYSYRIPMSGTGIDSSHQSVDNMFVSTGGSFTGTPSINTTYYTSNLIV